VKLHHVGIVTKQLTECIAIYEALGYSKAKCVYDPVQMASIALMYRHSDVMIELIAPVGLKSPAHKWLQRIKAGPYHICYETESLAEAMGFMEQHEFIVLMDPVPAMAFDGRRVAFLWSSATGLVELVESCRSAYEDSGSAPVEPPVFEPINQ
jgi:methylmalonyl-CoA/ethylmalonyl-CoA epimerase